MRQPLRLASIDHALAWLDRCAVNALVTDSRRVQPGNAFIAWPGYALDGREFVPDAFMAGALACLIEGDTDEAADTDLDTEAHNAGFDLGRDERIATLANLKQATGEIASRFADVPSEQLAVVAVTGTNGKTSTAWWIAQALSLLGRRAGVIGTLGVGEPPSPASPEGHFESTGLTTPDPVSLQAALRGFVDAGFGVCAIEASSIGIVEHRLAGTHIDTAVYTNFTRDHLDYHGTMTAYWQAKAQLFDWPGLRSAIVNLDDEQGEALAAQLGAGRAVASLWTYSAEGAYTAARSDARLQARSVGYLGGGLCFEIVEVPDPADDDGAPLQVVEVRTGLIGDYNVSNLLAVFATLRSLGVSLADAASTAPHLTSVPGRMQRVAVTDTVVAAAITAAHAHPSTAATTEPAATVSTTDLDEASPTEPAIVIDYAHTPDALEKALTSLRFLADQREGKLVCVFGCGGGRDASKRPLMGAIAQRLADRVVLTSDNPRHEAPLEIMAQVAAGFTAAEGQPVAKQIESRASAIVVAVMQADPRDVVLIAGKGHETDQDIAGVKTPFSDASHARAALKRRAAGVGMFTLEEARRMVPHAVLVGEPGTPIDRVNTDTRTLQPGDLFVALKGDRFDAHDFLPQAASAGAAAALAQRGLGAAHLPGLEVADTRKALGQLAAGWRGRFDLPLIAVTGSNGKTTVTQMVASILRAWHGDGAFSTEGNFNNDIGVPLTLLRLRNNAQMQHRAAVVELGMNHPGEIAELAGMTAPTVALVNNAQREHQEFMVGVEAVARENGSVIESLRSDGVAVFPADDEYAPIWLALAGKRRVMTFALRGDADVTGTAQWIGGHCWLQLRTPAGDVTAQLHVAGWHNVKNALAAAACALAAGCPLEAIARGLEAFKPVKGRSQLKSYMQGKRVVTLVDDTYNANPDSVRAAIDVLSSLPDPGWLILGDMGEVGDAGPEFHREVGHYAATLGVTWLWTVGALCVHAAEAFNETLMRGSLTGTFDQSRGVRHFASMAELLAAAASPADVPAAASVVVKGSRFMKMEQVVAVLVAGAEGGSDAA
ncbi:bifunctional UDP-N-acetylmuramoyl-L-alanyl-D-glutamate--2,6-diaminopimelate ligase MurE/UDP-N-acetylmuramoyl-tripeptide--D-alanyl-D-alanine ligase MurF [soil metagenome]